MAALRVSAFMNGWVPFTGFFFNLRDVFVKGPVVQQKQ